MKNLWGTVCGLALATALFSGCNRIKGYVSTLRGDDRNPPVARVYDTYLYRSDLRNIVPKGSSPQDSTAIVSRYIDAWITRQLILKTAQMNMPEGDLEKEIADFRELLLTGRYEQKIISERLDTLVNESEIEEYYQANKNNFTLDKDILCWSYLSVTYCDEALRKKLRTAFARDKAPSDWAKGHKNPDGTTLPWSWQAGVEDVMKQAAYNAPLVCNEWTELETLMGKYETDEDFASSAAQKKKDTPLWRKTPMAYIWDAFRNTSAGALKHRSSMSATRSRASC